MDGVLYEIGDGHQTFRRYRGIQIYAAELALRFHASLEDFVVVAPGVEGQQLGIARYLIVSFASVLLQTMFPLQRSQLSQN